jgi:hypothetical protein
MRGRQEPVRQHCRLLRNSTYEPKVNDQLDHRLVFKEPRYRDRDLYIALAVWGYYALINTPIDAIPDVSENQVIVFTDWAGRSPKEVEDQITYPLVTNLQGFPACGPYEQARHSVFR